jgi:hypothetical protein
MTPGILNMPSEAAVKAALLEGNKCNCATVNESLCAHYRNAHNALATSVTAGKRDIATISWPKPPQSFIPTYDADGYPIFMEQIGEPVCDPLPLPTPPPPAVDVNKVFSATGPGGVKVKPAPLRDTSPDGTVTMMSDGTLWVKKSSSTPFGVAHFYERLG